MTCTRGENSGTIDAFMCRGMGTSTSSVPSLPGKTGMPLRLYTVRNNVCELLIVIASEVSTVASRKANFKCDTGCFDLLLSTWSNKVNASSSG